MTSTPHDKNFMEVDFSMRYYIITFDSVEDRDSFEKLISNMDDDWRLEKIEHFKRGWLLRTPANAVASCTVRFLCEKGVIHEYRETSA